MRAWESFVADGDDDARLDTHVRPLIQQSWHRCALSSIDASRGEAPLARDEEESSGSATPARSCGTRPAIRLAGSAACSKEPRRC